MSLTQIAPFVFFVHTALMYTRMPTDYDAYGIKIAVNDRFLVSVDNLFLVWYIGLFPLANDSTCRLDYNLTTCDTVYSVVVPISNNMSFVYNCIDFQGNNVIGLMASNGTCTFQLRDERIVSNYSTQDNFVIDMNGDGTGVYGVADDFVLFYQLFPTIELTVWSNTIGISPRAIDIGLNQNYAVAVGYCQSSATVAVECGFVLRLNTSLSYPHSTSQFDISQAVTYPWSDPRSIRLITESRTYTPQSVMSVSICWAAKQVLIGVPSLNSVFLYALNDTHSPIGIRQNGVGFMGYGKSVAWLAEGGHKAVILANTYSYSTYQWVSSLVHVYDIQSDGFSDSTQPIHVYPNGRQTLHQTMDSTFIRLICSSVGHLGLLDRLGNGIAILSASPDTYANTNTTFYVTSALPCDRGTSRDYDGIELCHPHSARSNCSEEFFCPYGAVGEVPYAAFESVEQDQEYPESPENTVFDDLLMQNMFTFSWKSRHCVLVSPITWVLLVMVIGFTIVIAMGISEVFYPHQHPLRDQAKQIFKKMDLIGEGEIWIGGLITTAIIVFVVSAYCFSNAYLRRYPIEHLTGSNSFACDVTLTNAKFATTTQKRWDPRRSTKESQLVFDLLDSQPFTLNIDLIQTAYTCDDYFYLQRNDGYQITLLPITKCVVSDNNTILNLAISLPAREIGVQLVLSGVKTIGAIRIGLSAPSAEAEDGRFTVMDVNFASTFISSSLNQVLATTTAFPIELTKIVNRTDPLNGDGSATFSGIWTYSLTVNADQLFTNETRYTFFYRTHTNISITITQNIFYISNVQQPIARQTEVIFRCLLFTIVVLEVFGLFFLLVNLLPIPVFRTISKRLASRRKQVSPSNDLAVVVVNDKDPPSMSEQVFLNRKPQRRWSTTTGAREAC